MADRVCAQMGCENRLAPSNGGMFCRKCAERRAAAPELCSRGCGKLPHRGRCVKETAPQRTAARPKLDTLDSRSIPIAEIPPSAAPVPAKIGRLGQLWRNLLANRAKGLAEEVLNRDREHANSTLQHMREKAKAANLRVVVSRSEDGRVLYLYLVDREAEEA